MADCILYLFDALDTSALPDAEDRRAGERAIWPDWKIPAWLPRCQ
jgi:hypothetical protein